MGSLTAWAPTMVALALMGFCIYLVRKSIVDSENDMAVKLREVNRKIAVLEKEYLSESRHSLLCRNNALELSAAVESKITSLKDDIFSAIRRLEKTIKNGHVK